MHLWKAFLCGLVSHAIQSLSNTYHVTSVTTTKHSLDFSRFDSNYHRRFSGEFLPIDLVKRPNDYRFMNVQENETHTIIPTASLNNRQFYAIFGTHADLLGDFLRELNSTLNANNKLLRMPGNFHSA